MQKTITNSAVNETITFVQTAAESEGRATVLEITIMPGKGNGLQYRKTYPETFTALDHPLGMRLGKKTVILQPGESKTIEAGTTHGFFNPNSEPIPFRVSIEPAHQGFEYALRILSGLAADGKTNKKGVPKKFQHMAIIACMSEMNLPGVLSVLYPLLLNTAKKAKASGEEQRLIDVYCV